MKAFLFTTLLTAIAFCSCNDSTSHVCLCEYINLQDNIISKNEYTITGLNKEDASVECSNYETSDNPQEKITCILK